MTENDYWKIIEKSLKESDGSIDKQNQSLLKIFEGLDKEQLIGFCYHWVELYRKAYTSELWAAAYVVRGGCGDDSFHYFRCWLTTRSRKTYYNALDNPDSLTSEFRKYKYQDEIQSDSIRVLVEEYYKQKYPDELELEEVIDEEYEEKFDTKGEMEMSRMIAFNWRENDEESIINICPNLFKEYWGNPLKNKYLEK